MMASKQIITISPEYHTHNKRNKIWLLLVRIVNYPSYRECEVQFNTRIMQLHGLKSIFLILIVSMD